MREALQRTQEFLELFSANRRSRQIALDRIKRGAGRLYGTLFAGTQANVVAAIPEPGTWALMLLGVGGVATASRRGRSGRNAGPLMPA